MRRRVVLRGVRLRMPDSSVFGIIFLAVCFLAGAFGGHLFSSLCDASSQEALSAYLKDYCALPDVGLISVPVLRCLPVYFGYTAAVFVFSFSPLGCVFIPAAACVFGFRTMYTVSCFVMTFGRSGALLALSVLVIRLLFTLPCFLGLSDAAWPLSVRLAMLSTGRGKRCESAIYGGKYFLLLIMCVLILAVGVCCDRFFTPHLFRAAIRKLL